MNVLTVDDLPYEKPLDDTLCRISSNGEVLELYYCDANHDLQRDIWELQTEVTISVVNSGGKQMLRLSNDFVNVKKTVVVDVNKSSQYVRLWHYHDGTSHQAAVIGALDDRYLPACSLPFLATTYHLIHLQAQPVRISWKGKFGKNEVSLLYDDTQPTTVELRAAGSAQAVFDQTNN